MLYIDKNKSTHLFVFSCMSSLSFFADNSPNVHSVYVQQEAHVFLTCLHIMELFINNE